MLIHSANTKSLAEFEEGPLQTLELAFPNNYMELGPPW